MDIWAVFMAASQGVLIVLTVMWFVMLTAIIIGGMLAGYALFRVMSYVLGTN